MGVSVRDADPLDAATIMRLVCDLAASQGERSSPTEAYAEEFLAFPGCGVLLAEEDGQVAGLLAYSVRPNLYHAGCAGLIEELYVAEGFRGRGVGGALVGELLRRLQTMGCAEVSVSTLPENTAAVQFYKGLGLTDEAVLLEKHFRT